MIVAIVGIVHSYDLLPYYLNHYRGLGVDKFVISCDPDDLDPTGELQQNLLAQADIELVDLPAGFRRSKMVGMIEEEVRSRTAADWAIPADLDELNQYPGDLRELVAQLERDGATHVTGELRDRLAPGGVLAELGSFEDGISIWDQYPLEANVTAKLAGGLTEKVLLSRGDLAWTMGHHRLRDALTLRAFESRGVAHHFKWRQGLTRSLAWRIENEKRLRMPWCKESIQLSNYLLEHGRIVPEDVDATVGWRPDRS